MIFTAQATLIMDDRGYGTVGLSVPWEEDGKIVYTTLPVTPDSPIGGALLTLKQNLDSERLKRAPASLSLPAPGWKR